MTSNLGPYLLAIMAMGCAVVIILYGDPTRAGAWFPIFATIAAAIPGVIANLQLRDQATKLQEVKSEVNGNTQRQVNTAAIGAYNQGKLDAVADVMPVLKEAVTTERAAAAVEAVHAAATPSAPPEA